MLKRSADSGFTLMEVLIALLVVSIAVTAVLKVIHSQIFVTERIRDVDAARWVGMNVIARMQAGILPVVSSVQEGEESMMGKVWYWKADPQETENVHILQVSVSVGLHGDSLNHETVLGFVRRE